MQEQGAEQGSSVSNASRYVGWEVHCRWQHDQEDGYYPGQAWLLHSASSLSQAPVWHSPPQCTWCW